MKKNILLFFLIAFFSISRAQKPSIYNPNANAASDIERAITQAKSEHKYVLLQAGGNWCKWCVEFHRFCTSDNQLDSMIKNNFVWYHLNYSRENKNEVIFKKYGYAQRFGFPVFIILNENGERIHTQNSSYLEDGKSSYDKEKVMDFLKNWTPDALDSRNY